MRAHACRSHRAVGHRSAVPGGLRHVKLLGAAYLIYLGVRAVTTARQVAREHAAERETGSQGPAAAPQTPSGGPSSSVARWRSGFSQGFLTNVLNPKAALFFLSILPQFVEGSGSTTRQIFFLGILDVLIGIVYWFALVTVATRLSVVLARPKVRRRWELTTGWLFIAIGMGVAVGA
ncbi:LysE family translocator [Streptomyces pratensis]|uniref:LysE family translocator n=1 Tax=Streptomyces pratensis TaxID=1169025 RepID=UPI0037B4EE9E